MWRKKRKLGIESKEEVTEARNWPGAVREILTTSPMSRTTRSDWPHPSLGTNISRRPRGSGKVNELGLGGMLMAVKGVMVVMAVAIAAIAAMATMAEG
jgi:hypothetical protein